MSVSSVLSPRPAIDLLVLAAHPPELRGMRNELGEGLNGMLNGLYVVAKSVGVGMPVAGPSAMRRIVQLEPRAVVLLGTCGVYSGLADYHPHDIVIAQKVRLVDHGVIAGLASFPEPVQTEMHVNGPLTAGLAAAAPRARVVPVASPLAATRDDAIAPVISQQSGAHVESLEAFALAHACQIAQIPFAAVFAVSHVCGSTAQTDWPRFERQASLDSAEVIARWLKSGAQGLPLRQR
jgi:nucleoside phosphorylase